MVASLDMGSMLDWEELIQGYKFSGNLLDLENFTENALISENVVLYKRIGKIMFFPRSFSGNLDLCDLHPC